MGKRKLLVFASTFPRWKDDTNPPFVYELSKRLTKDFDVSVLAPNYPGAKQDEVMDKMKVHRFNYFIKRYQTLAGSGGILPTLKKNKWFYFQIPFFIIAEFFALRKQIKNNKPDVIHAHWIIPQGFVSYLNYKINKTPYVITTHGGDIFGLQGKLLTYLKKITLKDSKKITVVSNAIKKEILTKIDSNLKIEVIPMGVDTKLFNPNKKDNSIKKRYNINGSFLLFVGRLTEKKGVKYLIDAMPNIIKEYPEAKLMIIGSGELEKELKQQVKNLNINRSVIFMGAIKNSDISRYYATADIFVGPSIKAKDGDMEGLGLTFVEAGLSGCNLVGSNVGGILDVINKNDGFLTKEKDSKDISNKIIKLIKNPVKDKNKIRDELIKRFDLEIIGKEYGSLLE